MSRKSSINPWLVRLGMMVSDALLINVAFFAAYYMRYVLEWGRPVDPAYQVPYSQYLLVAFVYTLLALLTFAVEGLYHRRRTASLFEELYAIFNGTTTAVVLMIAVFFFYRPQFYSRLIFVYAALLTMGLLGAARIVEWIVLHQLRKRGIGVARLLIVGGGETGRTLMRHIMAHPELGYEIARLVEELQVDEVIITLPWQYHRKIMRILAQCERQNVRSRIVPDMFQLSLSHVDFDDIKGIPIIGIKEPSLHGWRFTVKRLMDVVLSAVLLVLFAPLMALIALLIKLDSPGPVLFKQTRVGHFGKPFTMYKFRTMYVNAEEMLEKLKQYNEADGPLFKMRNDPRRTRVGRWLRKFSLDELPQLWNVLKGDMSLVGPRPGLPSEVEQYEPWHRKRLEVPPGLTGLWQTSGRSRRRGVLARRYAMRTAFCFCVGPKTPPHKGGVSSILQKWLHAQPVAKTLPPSPCRRGGFLSADLPIIPAGNHDER